MDNKDKSIIDKILSIAGVYACAVSSLDGEVLEYKINDGEILPEHINRVSLEISKLIASYSISSIEINSLYLNFDDRNVIVNGFGSGFIFILSKRNSNVNLLKMETSYLEGEFVKIVNQSLRSIIIKPSANDSDLEENQLYSLNEDAFNSLKANALISKNKLDSIKDIFSASLGPISEMIFKDKIKELNENINNFNFDNIENLIIILSEEIEDKKDRLDFIKNAKDIINS